MSFLPKNYKAPAGSANFMKFEEGDNRIRILTPAVIGWEGWKDNKPFRKEGIEKNIEDDEVDIDPKYGKPKINHFWAFLVWNYAEKKVQILEITQKTVMKSVQGLVDDEDWGDPSKYDISVEKLKKGDRTSYSVKSYPPKSLSDEAQDAFDATELSTDELFRERDEEENDGNDEAEKSFNKLDKGGKKKRSTDM